MIHFRKRFNKIQFFLHYIKLILFLLILIFLFCVICTFTFILIIHTILLRLRRSSYILLYNFLLEYRNLHNSLLIHYNLFLNLFDNLHRYRDLFILNSLNKYWLYFMIGFIYYILQLLFYFIDILYLYHFHYLF